MREDWIECKFGDIITFKNGYAFKSTGYLKSGIPVIRIGDIKENEVLIENAICVDENKDLKEYEIVKDDILIAMSGATTGKFGRYNLNDKAYLNQRVGNIKPISDKYIYKSFLYYLLSQLKREIEKSAYGRAQPNISSKKIEELTIAFAPLPEQRAIVKKLESLFSSLDTGVTDLKKAQQQLKIYRQAVLKKAFEGEKREQKLINISDALGGFAFKSPDFLEKGIYQVIRIGNIRPDLIRLDSNPIFVNELNDKTRKYLLKDNDIVISLTGTRNKRDYGFSALVKNENLLLNQRLAAIRFNQDCNPKYYLHYFSTDYFKDDFFSAETGNTGQGNVGMNAIKETLVPFPSLLVQNEIVKQIESRLSVCDSIEQNIKESLLKAEALRQSILKKAFEGNLLTAQELEECKMANDYEPASVLLERIKKTKNSSFLV
ncbi:restriction endonuclease subunit S [Chryseobacterium sp. JJR-5R]|uniref:restriction endonuclease subunit S n=1 Tax=Chryseobacterium sp. JJR-5R TaxID=3093923 RepID=UPI002A7577C7|nr:restriction endonuclease subunit S [Chryseobacterium sp. JJR-5R]WPO84370.1 restriction endonuclease subunit S [Chryseobacterium sp. JJR-5R]